jgi:hypothetical protein
MEVTGVTWANFRLSFQHPLAAHFFVGLLLAAGPPGYAEPTPTEDWPNCSGRYDDDSTHAKMRDVVRINPWSFFDRSEELSGSYIDTVGYVAEFGDHLYLLPSAEYGQYYVPQYAARLEARSEILCGPAETLRDGDYVRIVGRVAVCDVCGGREATFDDVVLLTKLSYPQ